MFSSSTIWSHSEEENTSTPILLGELRMDNGSDFWFANSWVAFATRTSHSTCLYVHGIRLCGLHDSAGLIHALQTSVTLHRFELYICMCVWAHRSFWWSSLFVWMFTATVCSAIAISFCSLILNGSRGDTADGHTYNMHVLTWYWCALCTTAYVVINGQWIGEFHSRRIPRQFYCWQPLYQGLSPC